MLVVVVVDMGHVRRSDLRRVNIRVPLMPRGMEMLMLELWRRDRWGRELVGMTQKSDRNCCRHSLQCRHHGPGPVNGPVLVEAVWRRPGNDDGGRIENVLVLKVLLLLMMIYYNLVPGWMPEGEMLWRTGLELVRNGPV